MSSLIRVLHVVGRMNRGGVETWLMHVMRNTDRSRFAFDFLVHTAESSAYDAELRSLGARIIPCLRPQSLSYPVRLLRALRRHGPYDAIHSHVHSFSGVVLATAAAAGVPIRIAHSHNSLPSARLSLARRSYVRISARLLKLFATRGLAVSRLAAEDLFGPLWMNDSRWSVQHLGIDLEPFQETLDPHRIRLELGIPPGAFVVGHVGRFDPQKNHCFLLSIAAEAIHHRADARLLLVGDGPLRASLELRAKQLGIHDRVIFAGLRSDVPRMLRAMDVFVMPSLYEGLPLAAIEAQASGLPVVLSDAITPEVMVAADRCQALPLSASIQEWMSALFQRPRQEPCVAVAEIKTSSFNVTCSLNDLCRQYTRAGE